tara:strand:- start:345 stop:1922 length:1578 start_codon:yes stop_codon:yes gene_type:complete
MEVKKFDVIVIGSGINSLATAALLAQSGKSVKVFEARDKVGGLASTGQFKTGFKCNFLNDTIRWIDPRLLKKLDLKSKGLELIQPKIVRTALGDNNKQLDFYLDPSKTADSIASHSKKDAEKWKEFNSYINKLAQFLEKIYELTPPGLPNIGLKEAFRMRSVLTPIRKHGTRGIVDLLRVAPMMMPELVDEWFENDFLKSAISTAGIHQHSFGPYAAGTGYNLLHHHVHSKGIFHNVNFVKGGTEKFALALKEIAESLGVQIQCSTKVSAININDHSCHGITLDSGLSIDSVQVVSGLDPNNTFFNLIGRNEINPDLQRQLNNIRYRGSAARVHFALNKLPVINSITKENMITVFSINPSLEYLERASDSVKYGKPTISPYVEFTFPSLINEDFSPDGKHVLSATAQYYPYHLNNAKWNEKLKNDIEKNIIKTIEKFSPGFSSSIEYSHFLSPLDIENEFGLTEGNLNHGEMTLDQFMFMRPTISTSKYKTPIKNLYICGSGTHPGGGVHGTNGFNAAQEILKMK